MGISKKIEIIRQQPEHIRIRYVWASVTVSMIIIFTFWIFSITSLFKKEQKQELSGNIKIIQQQMQEAENQTPSLKETTNQPLTLDKKENEGVTDKNIPSNSESYADMDDSELPKSMEYSNLPSATGTDLQQE